MSTNRLIQAAPQQNRQRASPQPNSSATISAQSLCNYMSFDLPTQLEIDLFKSWKDFTNATAQCQTSSERLNVLQRTVSQNDMQHTKLMQGMLFAILVTPEGSARQNQNTPTCELIFSELNSIVRDHYKLVVYLVCQLTHAQFPYLKQQTVERILWLAENLIMKAVPGLKELVVALMQQISVSRSSSVSLYLNQRFAEILCKHVDWVCCKQINQADNFAQMVFLKFLRQAEEHYSHSDPIRQLRDIEIKLCLLIWERKQAECIFIGKEFVRIFGNLSGIEQLQPIVSVLRNPLQPQNPIYSKFQQHFQTEDLASKPLLKLMLEFGNNNLMIQGQSNMFQTQQGVRPNNQGTLDQRRMYLSLMVPTEVQRRIEFMLSQVPEQAVLMYSQWLLDFAGVEFGTESESLLIDIVRFIVVNVQPTNEVIHSSILQRFTLIGHFIAHQKHQLHKSWVLQALFIDWIYYEDQSAESIMLVEPGMLLMYRSASQRPWLTDMLVEFLDNYVRNYDPVRVADAMLSVQLVMLDCEKKGVIKSIVDGMINQPNLQLTTQTKLKQMYQASEIYGKGASKNRLTDNQQLNQFKIPIADFDMQDNAANNTGGVQTQEEDFAFADEEDGVGQFSPPHEPAKATAANSPFANSPAQSPFSLEQGVFATNQNKEKDNMFAQAASQYKIDLFDAQDGQSKVSAVKADDDAMSSSSSSSHSSSSSESQVSSSSEKEQQQAPQEESQIQVPKAVMQRFFSNKTILDEFFTERNQKTLFAALDDYSGFYVLSTKSTQELTELAHILFQSFKESLSQNDMLKFATKWKNLEFIDIFRYMSKVINNNQRFSLMAHLIKSFAQFDQYFELKMAVHFLLEPASSWRTSGACIKKYAQMIYPCQEGENEEEALQNFINDKVIKELTDSSQYKFMNFVLTAVLDVIPTFAVDNSKYLEAIMIYAVPATLQKIATNLRLNPNTLRFFSGANGLQTTLKNIKFKRSYLYQRTLWTILSASFDKTPKKQVQEELNISQVLCDYFMENARDLIVELSEEKDQQPKKVSSLMSTTSKNVSIVSELAGVLIGFQEFMQHFCQKTFMGKDAKAVTFLHLKNCFNSFLDLYSTLDRESSSKKEPQKPSLKPLLREIAQTILACLFQKISNTDSTGESVDEDNNEIQKLLIASVIQNFNEAVMLEQKNKQINEQRKKRSAQGRLKSAKEIFSSKMSHSCVQQNKMQDIVSQLVGIEINQ